MTKKIITIALVASVLAAPSLTMAQAYGTVSARQNTVVAVGPKVIVQHTNVTSPNIIMARNEVMPMHNDRHRFEDRDFDQNQRHDSSFRYGRNARFITPVITRHGHNNRGPQCGMGAVTFRLPSGRLVTDRVLMCKSFGGEWRIAQ